VELDVEVGYPAVPGTETPDGVNVAAGVAVKHDLAAASADAFVGGALEFTVAFPLKLQVAEFLFVPSYSADMTYDNLIVGSQPLRAPYVPAAPSAPMTSQFAPA